MSRSMHVLSALLVASAISACASPSTATEDFPVDFPTRPPEDVGGSAPDADVVAAGDGDIFSGVDASSDAAVEDADTFAIPEAHTDADADGQTNALSDAAGDADATASGDPGAEVPPDCAQATFAGKCWTATEEAIDHPSFKGDWLAVSSNGGLLVGGKAPGTFTSEPAALAHRAPDALEWTLETFGNYEPAPFLGVDPAGEPIAIRKKLPLQIAGQSTCVHYLMPAWTYTYTSAGQLVMAGIDDGIFKTCEPDGEGWWITDIGPWDYDGLALRTTASDTLEVIVVNAEGVSILRPGLDDWPAELLYANPDASDDSVRPVFLQALHDGDTTHVLAAYGLSFYLQRLVYLRLTDDGLVGQAVEFDPALHPEVDEWDHHIWAVALAPDGTPHVLLTVKANDDPDDSSMVVRMNTTGPPETWAHPEFRSLAFAPDGALLLLRVDALNDVMVIRRWAPQ